MIYVIMYLAAIVLANLTLLYFGPSWSLVNAFLFIGLDLTARDKLHDSWHNDGLIWKMGLLIALGSMLSYLLNKNVAQIALASFVSFAVVAVVDTIIYQILHKQPRWLRINGSNIPSAAIDSLLFPTLAFGSFMPLISIGQFAAKVVGGAFWSLVLLKLDKGHNGQVPAESTSDLAQES